MPLPRPQSLRVVATPDDSRWCELVQEAVATIDEAIFVDSSNDLPNTARPKAVLMIWSEHATASASLHREVVEWDRRRTSIHLLAVNGTDVLGYMKEMVDSTLEYSGPEPLREWVQTVVLGMAGTKTSMSATDRRVSTFAEAVEIYASELDHRLSEIQVVGQDHVLQLDEVYLPLQLRDLNRAEGQRAGEAMTLVDLLSESAGQRVFVIGTPGAGKSTLLDYTAHALVSKSGAPPASIPLLVRAADVLASGQKDIVDYLRIVVKGCVPRVGRQVSAKLIDADEFGDQETALLIDGVDELKLEDRRRLRQMLRRFETEFPDASIVLASRPSGYEVSLWADYRPLAVQPLESLSVQSYVEKFAPVSTRKRLTELLASSSRLRELAEIPFMLALMCSLEGGEELPLRRAVLIKTCVASLLARRSLDPEIGHDEHDVEECFTSIADRLFRLDVSGRHSESEFSFALQTFISQRPRKASAVIEMTPVDSSSLILDQLIDRTGLLQRDGEFIDFVHRSIWEYFVALALSNRGVDAVDEIAGSPAWEEPVRLMVGLANETDVHAILRRLWPKNTGLALRAAAECAFDLHDLVQELLASLPEGESAALVRDLGVMLEQSSDRESAERVALDTLGVLLPEEKSCETLWEGLQILLGVRARSDDARELVMSVFRFDHVESRREELLSLTGGESVFVTVPRGEYAMGNDQKGRSVGEGPCHQVIVSKFSICALTSTNMVRAIFPFHLGLPADRRSPTASHPLVGVTWYEAMIFAIWFGCRLPTEAEWEYACRAQGNDDLVLFDESKIAEVAWYAGNAQNTTHPVGARPPNSLGIYDMLGNVREWCSDWYEERYYSDCELQGTVEDPSGPLVGQHRVLRGGCFDWNTANLVPTYRNSNQPDNRGFQNGVRLVFGLPTEIQKYIEERASQTELSGSKNPPNRSIECLE